LGSFPNTRAEKELLQIAPEIFKRLRNGETVQLRLSRRGLLKVSAYTFQQLHVRSEEGGAVNG